MMSSDSDSGIYLIVYFDWPTPFKADYAEKAKQLHKATQNKDWIREEITASGGIGEGASSVWIFWLKNYASLDQLFNQEDEIGKAYKGFFQEMGNVSDLVREQVIFS
jgi:hypothetical protein